MSTVTDEMILAAVRAFNRIPGLFPAMKGALEAAEAVRAKASANCGQDAMWQGIGVAMKRAAEQTLTVRVDSDPRVSQSAAFMTPAEKPTTPESFIPWRGGECPHDMTAEEQAEQRLSYARGMVPTGDPRFD
jgi:hypothetical protein